MSLIFAIVCSGDIAWGSLPATKFTQPKAEVQSEEKPFLDNQGVITLAWEVAPAPSQSSQQRNSESDWSDDIVFELQRRRKLAKPVKLTTKASKLADSSPTQKNQWQTIYLGPDTGSVRAGLSEGQYQYRVRALSRQAAVAANLLNSSRPQHGSSIDGSLTKDQLGPWSPLVYCKIEYIDRNKVIALLAIGALVFFATLACLIFGHFTTRSNSGAAPSPQVNPRKESPSTSQ